jgi:hypothetical protein
MGRLASGTGFRMFLGASVVFLWAASGLAQVPVPTHGPSAGEALPPEPPPPPAAEPTPPPAPQAKPRPAPLPAPPPTALAPPPLDPPPSQPEPSRPAFLHTAAEMARLKPQRARAEQAPLPEPSRGLRAPQATVPDDFVLRASPWIDFTLTSFYMENRAGNFLNLGVQVGGYVFERLRVSARLVAPLEDVSDDYSHYSSGTNDGSGSFNRVNARSMTMLYGASVGLLITNSKTFAFGPSVELQRTNVEAYGSALSLGLPFEWTTHRNLRVGFEFALGHAFGGSVQEKCRTFSTPSTSCGTHTSDRPAGTAVLFQYYMGWSLGGL